MARPVAWIGAAALIGLAAPAAADYSAGMLAYEDGDYRAAFTEFEDTAEAGDADSQYMLGRLYAEGLGVRQDYVQAHGWFNLAASQGHRRAATARSDLEDRMTSEQIARAQSMAAEWAPADRDRAAGSTGEAGDVIAGGAVGLREIQRALERLGYDPGPVDGQMGRATRDAIRAYESDQGLPVTGRPSARLYTRLQDSLAGRGDSAALGGYADEAEAATVSPRLVAEAQGELRRRGYEVPSVSGTLDPETRAAIRTYQADAGLPITGKVTESLLAHFRSSDVRAGAPATPEEAAGQAIQGLIESLGREQTE